MSSFAENGLDTDDVDRESTSISHSVVVSVKSVILNTIKVVVSNFFIIFTNPLINDDTESIDVRKAFY